MSTQQYMDDYEFSKIAHEFVEQYLGQVTGLNWLHLDRPVNTDACEGADSYGLAFWDHPARPNDIGGGNISRFGGLEIKALRDMKVLGFYSPKNKQIPTFPVEIWSDDDRSYWGWLYALTHAKQHNEINEARGILARAIPGTVFTYVFYGYPDSNECYHPFMAITIQGFPQFYNTIRDYAKRTFNWDLDAWDLPPAGNTAYWKKYPQCVSVFKKMWNIPLDVIINHLYIVMIDDPPQGMNDEERMRYEFFASHSHYSFNTVTEKKRQDREIINDAEHNEFNKKIEAKVMKYFEDGTWPDGNKLDMLKQSEDHEN